MLFRPGALGQQQRSKKSHLNYCCTHFHDDTQHHHASDYSHPI
jgi:hypothetical protein